MRAVKVFRSKKPAQLGIQSGQSSIEVYLKKETDEQPRNSSLKLEMAPSSATPVFLSVEQTPALGRASIQVKADKIGLNTNLDWDTAEIVESTWPELLNDLGTKSVPIPERLVKELTQRDGKIFKVMAGSFKSSKIKLKAFTYWELRQTKFLVRSLPMV